MKMVIVIAPEERRDELRNVLAAHDVRAHSEITRPT